MGGGLSRPVTATIVDTTISGNVATNGGGVYASSSLLFGPASTAITRSTISGNSASAGGGVYAGGFGGSLSISNATVSSNTASGAGGAIYASTGTSIRNSTITANSSASGGAVMADGGASISVRNTIVANSTGTAPANCVSLDIVSLGNNIEFPGTSCGFSSIDPLLGPLANNGGPTFTHALMPASPAIDAGDDATCLASPVSAVDQRGTIRPLDAHCDVGAFEAPVNIRPTITFIPSARLGIGDATSALAFTVGDVETTAANLTVSATSSNTTLVPNTNIVFGGTGTSRTVTVTPAAGQCGMLSMITVTVNDGGRTSTMPFRVVCFTDNVITTTPSPVTLIRRAHVVELRALIDHIRTTIAGLPAFGWTDVNLLVQSSVIRAQHLLDLRVALSQAYAARSLPAPSFSTSAPTPQLTMISRVHFEEIRNLALALINTP
jgi:predicted outer membrane repeat protein